MMVVIGGLTCKLVLIPRLCPADNSSPSGIRVQCGRWESIHGNALAGYVPTDSKRGMSTNDQSTSRADRY